MAFRRTVNGEQICQTHSPQHPPKLKESSLERGTEGRFRALIGISHPPTVANRFAYCIADNYSATTKKPWPNDKNPSQLAKRRRVK